MKTLLFTVLMSCSLAYAKYNPTMRINFGASNAIVRLQAGYFTHVPDMNKSETHQANFSPVANMRFNAEMIMMVNNRFRFEESTRRTPARFIVAKLNRDGIESNMLGSISFGQSLKCRAMIPIFGQVKGFWSIGAATLIKPINVSTEHKTNTDIGGRIGFNIYNKQSALQSEVCIFEKDVRVNFIIHKKLSEHIMMKAGVESNRPVAGLSLLAGSHRFTVSTRLIGEKLQHGFTVTANF